MPLNAYGVLGTFVAAAVAIGSAVTWIVGPRRPSAAVLPIGAGVIALSVVGHSLKVGVGPSISLFGYDVHLPFDLAVATVVALAVALIQRAFLSRRTT
jgi:hypothetical protein